MNATLTGRGVLIWLAAFFAVVIATNAYFITLSVTTFRGEDEQKPYLQGIEYNDTLERRAEQARLGWRATISAIRLPTGHVGIHVELHDHNGQPLAGVPLSAELRHPSDENRDFMLQLRAMTPGRYQTDAGPIGAGYWDLIVTSTRVGAPFEATRRLWVP